MKFFPIILSGIIIVLQVAYVQAVSTNNHGMYYHELKLLKKAPTTKQMFDKDAHSELSEIQRDIIIYKNLTSFQRYVRSLFLVLDVVVVTPETMPLLYSYVERVCKVADIAVPTVFVTRQNGFFNAFAQKLLISTGGIVIGQQLIKELSDDSIEAVIAHEIGHIKYNHVNKYMALSVLELVVLGMLVSRLDKGIMPGDTLQNATIKQLIYWSKVYILSQLTSYISPLIINKRFEKQADEFAYKTNGKSTGLIEFFELLLKKDQLREEEFASVYRLLQDNKDKLSLNDYYSLIIRYYLARAGQLTSNFYKKIYHETFIGAHPSHQARIDTIKKYRAMHKS